MFKKGIFLVIVLVLMSASVCLAAPESLSLDVGGNTNSLMVLTNPSGQQTSTFDNKYVISGYAKEGVNISLYYKNGDRFSILYPNGNRADWYVGASGLFIKQIDLAKGKNVIIVRAEKDGLVQVEKYTINLLSKTILDIFKIK